MNTTRFLPRRPLYRCLNTPPAPLRQPRIPKARFSNGRPSRIERFNTAEFQKAQHESVAGMAKQLSEAEYVSMHRVEIMRRNALIRKRNWLALGAALSMVAPMILVQLWDLPPPAGEEGKNNETGGKDVEKKSGTIACDAPKTPESFQGKQVVIAAGDKIIATSNPDAQIPSADVDAVELVETGTSYVPYFPKTISLPSSTGPEDVASSSEYTLLGLGIRKVSFLRVQVYVVGLYVKTSELGILQNHLINTINPTASALIPGEKEDLRNNLLDAEKSEEIWNSILQKKGTDAVQMALRVVPVRGTDFKHLQDGWMRGIASRTDEVRRKQQDLIRQQAAEKKQIALPQPVSENEFADESFGLSMKEFKALFQGRGKAPKGSVITLTRDREGGFGAWYQPIRNVGKEEKADEMTKLGQVRDERVSRLVWMLYLGGKNVSSEDARKNIVDGCIGIVERPVGTVEGRVQ